MRLARFIPPSSSEAVDGEIIDHQAVAFADGGTVKDRLQSPDDRLVYGESWSLDDVALLAPLGRPRAIFAVGLNYVHHAAEAKAELPDRPLIFMKLDRSSAPPNALVRYPKIITQLDYEGELAVVIGAGGKPAGYAVADDLSARDLQRAEPQWTRAKAFDNSCPWGPWITTIDEIDDPQSLRLRTYVNGDVRQDASTREMVFDIPTIVSFIAETCTMLPGDLILTGTPAGVGVAMHPPRLLGSGDVVKVEIDGLGWIEHGIGEPAP